MKRRWIAFAITGLLVFSPAIISADLAFKSVGHTSVFLLARLAMVGAMAWAFWAAHSPVHILLRRIVPALPAQIARLFSGLWLAVGLGATSLLLALESLSYYLQATGINEVFLRHSDPTTAWIGAQAYPKLGLLVLVLLLLILLLAFGIGYATSHPAPTLSKRHRILRILLPVLCATLVLTFIDNPARALVQTVTATKDTQFEDDPEVHRYLGKFQSQQDVPLQANAGRNLVWIYVESMEAGYFDDKAFPALTPNLQKLAQEGITLKNFQGQMGADVTIAGMVASQCGFPLAFNRNDALFASNSSDTSYLQCIGDILASAGYAQTYLGGASLDFSGKGMYYRSHGYDTVLGREELKPKISSQTPMNLWGLYDDTLFSQAAQVFDDLAQGQKPFNLTLLTVDTHGPDGAASPSCAPYAGRADIKHRTMLDAVHCTDQLLPKFIAHMRASPAWENTTVVLMGDHLLQRSDVVEHLEALGPRTIFFTVLNAAPPLVAQDNTAVTAPVYHVDIAPSVLEAMGVQTSVRFPLGSSVWPRRHEIGHPPTLVDQGLKGFLKVRALASMLSTPTVLCAGADEPLRVEIGPMPTLTLGEQRIIIARGGSPRLPRSTELFAVAGGDDGIAEGSKIRRKEEIARNILEDPNRPYLLLGQCAAFPSWLLRSADKACQKRWGLFLGWPAHAEDGFWWQGQNLTDSEIPGRRCREIVYAERVAEDS